MKVDLAKVKKVYFVGIKGTGMVALVEIMKKNGSKVSGSDVADRFFTDDILNGMGVEVHQGFCKKNIKKTQIDLIIHSAAYDLKNEELMEAKKKGIPTMLYSEALGELFSDKYGIGVVGTHGKTSTTSMMGVVMKDSGYKPTVIVGTGVKAFGGRNSLLGSSDFMVAELCEYRRHFLKSKPKATILTGIGFDHPDYFTDLDDVKFAYKEFFENMDDGGILVYAKNKDLQEFVDGLRFYGKKISYGVTKGFDVWTENIKVVDGRQSFTVYLGERKVGDFEIRIPGKHMVLNAVGVIAMSLELGLPIEKIKDSLKGFGGLKRRTEILGEKDGVLYIDDYGHHPAEIRTTLDGLKNFYPDRRVRCVFQAHTFSRTESLIDEFAKCFSGAEEVLITDIFGSAREDVKSFDVNGEKLAWEIKRHHKNVKYTPRFEDAVASLREDMKVGDLVVCMGAGNAYEVALNLLEN